MSGLRPFWRYYGGKWRAAPHYPKPTHTTIVEPFAGAAGYSLRYPHLNVVLIEKYPIIAEMWRWLIAVTPSEVMSIPEVDSVDELPEWVSAGARSLVGFAMNAGVTSPRKVLSSGRRKFRDANRQFEGWSSMMRARVAHQVDHIRHWKVIEGDYTTAPDILATWFIDPPYQLAGRHYVHSRVNYAELAKWSLARRGQVMVCENNGATWLPFAPLGVFKAGPKTRKSAEAMFYMESGVRS